MYICSFSYLLFYYYNELQTYSYSCVAYHRLSCYCAKASNNPCCHAQPYWCPGDLQQPDVIDLFTKPGRHTAVLRMEPYTAADIHGNCLIVIKSEAFPIVFLEVFEHDKK